MSYTITVSPLGLHAWRRGNGVHQQSRLWTEVCLIEMTVPYSIQ